MLKKFGLPLMALVGMLTFAAPQKADARVRFGISVGGPVYTAPVPVYPYAYPASPYDQGYYATPAYPYDYGYGYQAPYYGGFSYGWGGHHWDHERHERFEHYEHGRSFGHGHDRR